MTWFWPNPSCSLFRVVPHCRFHQEFAFHLWFCFCGSRATDVRPGNLGGRAVSLKYAFPCSAAFVHCCPDRGPEMSNSSWFSNIHWLIINQLFSDAGFGQGFAGLRVGWPLKTGLLPITPAKI
eukprot:EG_transcript_23767